MIDTRKCKVQDTYSSKKHVSKKVNKKIRAENLLYQTLHVKSQGPAYLKHI